MYQINAFIDDRVLIITLAQMFLKHYHSQFNYIMNLLFINSVAS